jgi:DNA-binding MltR family transcriptional regulator
MQGAWQEEDGPVMKRQLDWSDPDVKLAQEILLGTLLDSFREERAATALENELLKEAEELRDFLIGQDTRTFCILAVSFMEDALKRRFSEQWNITGATDESRYFGSNGPLSTFSQRLAVARGLGWLDTNELAQASILRKIRNLLAHNHKVHNIDCEPLAGLAESLRPIEQVWYKGEMENYVAAYDVASKSTKLRMRIYCNSIFVVSAAISRSKLIAAHLPPNMRDGTGYDSLTEVQQRFIDHCIRHCFKSLGINRSSKGAPSD